MLLNDAAAKICTFHKMLPTWCLAQADLESFYPSTIIITVLLLFILMLEPALTNDLSW